MAKKNYEKVADTKVSPMPMMGQPIFLITTKKERTAGKDALKMNITAAKAVAECVRTTLGPKSMDKMLVEPSKDITITNDGAVILKEMSIEHPTAKLIVETSKTQEEAAGDGTTSVVLLGAELLTKAEDLVDKEVHPTIISKGYELACQRAIELVKKMAKPVDKNDKETLKRVAKTAMTGKAGESYSDLLADIAVDAVLAVEDNGSVNVDDNIKMMKKVGLRTEKTELIRGIVIDKKRAHPQMPKRVKNAKIAVLSKGIEAKKVDLPKAKMKIEDPNELESFLKEEEIVIEETVKELADAGVNVVFTEKGIDDTGKHFLIKYGIMGVERVSSGDIKKISRATGARVISNTKDISPDDLGEASIVEEVGEEEKELIYIRDAKNTKAITIVIHAGTEQIAEEVERMLDDAVRVVACVVEDGYIVAGGGAPEVELALQLREYANTLKGREQLAVDAFANSLEVIPRTLAENAGLDPIDKLVELRSAHEKGMVTAGLDVYTGEVVDMWEMGVVEPLKVKTQAIASATEAAVMILRIDDVLASKPPEEEEKEEEEEKPPSFTGEEFGGGDFGGF